MHVCQTIDKLGFILENNKYLDWIEYPINCECTVNNDIVLQRYPTKYKRTF